MSGKQKPPGPQADATAAQGAGRRPGAKPTRRAVRPPAPRPRRGTLVLIAGLLASAGLIRLGLGLNQARALEGPVTQPAAVATAACPAAANGPVMPLVAALKAREARLAAREAAVQDRAQALALTGKAVAAKLAELKAAEARLSRKIAFANGAAEKDVAQLTAVYENMKPKDAAAVFEQMQPEFAAGFLGRMKPEAAAAILSGMTPEKAYTVSVIVAGRNARGPKN
jgi:flagellar motility protein MotE (MotC chaperone)